MAPLAFASGLVSSSTPTRLLFLRKTESPVGHGSHHAILEWKKVMGCVPLAAPREKSAWSKWLLSSTSVQEELFPHPNCAGFRVSAKTRACAEVISGQIFPWAGGDNCFLSMGRPPRVTQAGVSLQASEVERQLSLQVHTLREDFREKNSSSSQHIVRLESLQAEVSHLCTASLLQKAARAVVTCIMNPSELGKQNLLLGANKEKDGSCGAKASPSEDFCCNPGLAGLAPARFHCCLGHKHACKMNR